jgi:hypothetical protein
MFHNRISTYMNAPRKRPQIVPKTLPKTVLGPPPNFAPVPVAMLAHVPQAQISWQEELYRMAYEAARASVAAAANASDRYRWN